MQQKKHIFLSYSRVDTKFAKKLADDLRKQELDIWMDSSNIAGGKHWDNDIEEALKSASVVILVVSPASVKSENVKDEVAFAKHRGIRIIPILYKEAETPLGWDRLQWIEMDKDYQQGIDELIACIYEESYHDRSKKKSRGFFKLLLGLFILGALGAWYYFYNMQEPIVKQKVQPKQIPIPTQNTIIYKENRVVIGNGNSDINITQE